MDPAQIIGDLLIAVFTDLVATAVAIPVVTYIAVKFFQNFRSARIWGTTTKFRQVLQSRPYPTMVLSTSDVYVTASGYRRPMTGIGQVRALAWFGKSLNKAYRGSIDNTRVVFSEEYRITRDEFTDDLILIGGPKTNSIANALLNDGYLSGVLPEDFQFGRREETLDDGTRQEMFRLMLDGKIWEPRHDDEVTGVVIRCRNPLSAAERNMTYVGGLGTYGTEAAAVALTEQKRLHEPAPLSWKWLKRKFQRRGKYAYLALVGAKLGGDGATRRVGETKVLAFRELEWSAPDR